jgi:tetratricopeptide (TPR) repeat protein
MNDKEKQRKAEEYFKQGIACYDHGDYGRAIEFCNKAIELKPHNAKAYYNLGNSYYNQGDYARAIESLNEAIKLKPKFIYAHICLGIAYFKHSDYVKAIESYNEGIKIKPDLTYAHIFLGIAYFKQGDYVKAIESYNEGIKLDPDDANIYYSLIESCKNEKYEYVNAATIILNNNKKHFKKDIVHIMSLYPNIDELIRKLLNTDYDDDFTRMLRKYNITDKKSEEYGIYEKIYLSSIRVMQLLHVNNEEETGRGLAHYTRKIIAEALLIKEKESTSPFRLNSIITSNDPTEGAIAFEYLGLKNEEKDRNYQAFIACFTFDPECLNQFRLYGKDQGKEATGVSLVFRKSFFAEKPAGMAQAIASEIDNMTKQFGKENDVVPKQDTKEEYALYRCVYIDPETKQIMALGHKDDYTFFRDKLADKRKKDLPDEEKKEVNGEIETYKEKINNKLEDVREEFEKLKELIQDNKDKVEEKLVCDLLINLRYLVKHIAFKEEQECRIVKVASLGSQGKVKLVGDSMYIDTRTVDKLVDRVYFAPSATDMELFHEKLVHTGLLTIECRKCTHPIRISKT